MTERGPSDDAVEERAQELAHGGEDAEELEGRPEDAERAAERILDESEERTFDPATLDPERDTVIRRSSDETAR